MEMASVGWRSAGDPTCSSGSVADLPSGANCAHGEPAASRSAGVAAGAIVHAASGCLRRIVSGGR